MNIFNNIVYSVIGAFVAYMYLCFIAWIYKHRIDLEPFVHMKKENDGIKYYGELVLKYNRRVVLFIRKCVVLYCPSCILIFVFLKIPYCVMDFIKSHFCPLENKILDIHITSILSSGKTFHVTTTAIEGESIEIPCLYKTNGQETLKRCIISYQIDLGFYTRKIEKDITPLILIKTHSFNMIANDESLPLELAEKVGAKDTLRYSDATEMVKNISIQNRSLDLQKIIKERQEKVK